MVSGKIARRNKIMDRVKNGIESRKRLCTVLLLAFSTGLLAGCRFALEEA